MIMKEDLMRLERGRILSGLLPNGKVKTFYFLDLIPLHLFRGRVKRFQLLMWDVIDKKYHIAEIDLEKFNAYSLEGMVDSGMIRVDIQKKGG